MIWHFLEVWMVLLAAFLVGCGLGAAAYAGIGNSSLSNFQGRLADAIGDLIDRIKARLGLGPDWRDGMRMPIERPVRVQRPLRRSRKARFGRYRTIRDDVALARDDLPADDVDQPQEGAWPPEETVYQSGEWPEHALGEGALPYEDEPRETEPPMRLVPAGSRQAEPIVAKRPAPLLAPRNGVPDNLQRIRGIGKANEELLNSFGIFHFGQIAAWTPAEALWVAERMPFPERIDRDDWIGQATILASGAETGYVKSAERRRARRAADPGDGENDEEEDKP
jgi:predicted flap endonuclease-1-like 5' DNA nuclease